jgi:hypothetical protein
MVPKTPTTSNHARDLRQAMDQEELYCSFDVERGGSDLKEILVDLARRLEDFRICWNQSSKRGKPRVTQKQIQTQQAVPKDFKLCWTTDASAKRGFDTAVKRAPTTPKSAACTALRRVPLVQPKLVLASESWNETPPTLRRQNSCLPVSSKRR